MSGKSDFMAAEEIKGILGGRDKTEQERIVRWVCESLGLSGAATAQPPNPLSIPTTATPPTVPHVPHTPHAGTKAKDIRTFIDEKKPKNDLQVAAVVGYYYLFEASDTHRKEILTPKELNDAARQGRGFSFKDARMTLNNAVRQGYFDRAGLGKFKLNAVGENLVAMALPGWAAAYGGAKRRRKAKGKKRT